MRRLLIALLNSLRALRRLAAHERAFQQELVAFIVSLPAAWFLTTGWRDYLMLVGVVLLLIIVEVLNTAIEAACDALSRDFHPEIQYAKDCGSLAVLLAMVIAVTVWGLAIFTTLAGTVA